MTNDMEIKTKFNLGDRVIVLKDGKAKEIEIKTVLVGTDNRIFYSDDEPSYIFKPFHEDECFATKEELIEYITSDD